MYVSIFINEEYFSAILKDLLVTQEDMKVQPLTSLIYVASYYALYRKFEDASNFENIVKLVSLNIGNNSSFARYLSQYVLARLIDEGKVEGLAGLEAYVEIMKRNKDNMVLTKLFGGTMRIYKSVIDDLTIMALLKSRLTTEKLEIVHGYVCDQFKDLSIQNTINQIDDSIAKKPDEAITEALSEMFSEVEQQKAEEDEDAVFQRKIDNLLSVFPVNETRVKRKCEIVVIASLLEKMPNLANLTRTCEIFGVKELVIPTKNILRDVNFLTVTVTAEKWLPFVECAPANLAKLLMMYREDGYKVSSLLLRSSPSSKPANRRLSLVSSSLTE